jgi:acyl-CoA thioesterase
VNAHVTHSDNARALAEQVCATMLGRDRASRELGMRLVSIAPGRVSMAMTVRADMLNGHLICHGGFIFALSDSAFAFACNSHGDNTLAAACSIDYLAVGREGDELTASAQEVWRAGKAGIYEVTVTNQRDERIALFRGRSHRIEGRVLDALTGPAR